jgi:hypothetical protein
MANPIGEAVYAALSDNVNAAVYVMGDVPDTATFPYVTYAAEDVRSSRMSINSRMQTRDLVVEVLARSVAEAEEIGASVEEAIVGLSVAATENISPFPGGFERAEGVWRSFDTDPSEIDGDRYYRIVLLFEQRETTSP